MLRRILLPALALLAALCTGPQAEAANHGAYAGFPFGYGFYQPYGARYSTSVRTPPYFAVNPPVYYGTRHYRPYGASPFASLPLVEAGPGYQTRAADRSVWRPSPAPLMNPHCEAVEIETEVEVTEVSHDRVAQVAPIRENPFAAPKLALAKAAGAN